MSTRFTANVSVKKTVWGTELACDAGQRAKPVGCERHSSHYYCSTCVGWYGVPHHGIHKGVNKHPSRATDLCACRPCRERQAAP